MSTIKNGGLDQYGAKPFEQQQFGTAGFEAVKICLMEKPLEKHTLEKSATLCVIQVVYRWESMQKVSVCGIGLKH